MLANKKVLITGITGQDGSYLAEFLLNKGYQVHGIIRRVAMENPSQQLWRIKPILDKISLHVGSLDSFVSIFKIVEEVKPDECYHLAAQSFVNYSFEDAFPNISANLEGTLNLLSAIKQIIPSCRLYFAGSSEMFGKVLITPQNEDTPFYPRSPYGISKLCGFHLVRNYRESYNIFACTGIAFNHESERRGFEFVTRKISSGVAKIKLGLERKLSLGNLNAQRDWGYAKDFVKAMWLMLQAKEPEDYVLATGQTHTVKEFVQAAFDYVGLNWQDYIIEDKSLYRPSEDCILRGDNSKAKKMLNWQPTVYFDDLVKIMVAADLVHFKNQIEQEA